MGVIALPRRPTARPESLRVNRDHPLLRHAPLNGLFVLTGLEQTDVHMLVGSSMNHRANLPYGPDEWGAFYSYGTNSGARSYFYLDTTDGGTFLGSGLGLVTTRFALVRADEAASASSFFYQAEFSNGAIGWNSSKQLESRVRGNNSAYHYATGPTMEMGRSYAVAVVTDWIAQRHTLVVEGATYETSLTGTDWYSSGRLSDTITYGYSGSNRTPYNALIGISRAGSVDAAVEWTRDPWALFERPTLFVPVSGGPTTPTLSNFVATNITSSGARLSVDLAF